MPTCWPCAKPLDEVSFCYLGDGRNNTASSLLVTGGLLGMDARICAPAALQPSSRVQAIARGLAAGSGAKLTVTDNLAAAVRGADFLPALHNRDTEIGQQIYEKQGLEALEVIEEVFESPQSVVFDQAANRLPTIKVVMVATIGIPAGRHDRHGRRAGDVRGER